MMNNFHWLNCYGMALLFDVMESSTGLGKGRRRKKSSRGNGLFVRSFNRKRILKYELLLMFDTKHVCTACDQKRKDNYHSLMYPGQRVSRHVPKCACGNASTSMICLPSPATMTNDGIYHCNITCHTYKKEDNRGTKTNVYISFKNNQAWLAANKRIDIGFERVELLAAYGWEFWLNVRNNNRR